MPWPPASGPASSIPAGEISCETDLVWLLGGDGRRRAPRARRRGRGLLPGHADVACLPRGRHRGADGHRDGNRLRCRHALLVRHAHALARSTVGLFCAGLEACSPGSSGACPAAGLKAGHFASPVTSRTAQGSSSRPGGGSDPEADAVVLGASALPFRQMPALRPASRPSSHFTCLPGAG